MAASGDRLLHVAGFGSGKAMKKWRNVLPPKPAKKNDLPRKRSPRGKYFCRWEGCPTSYWHENEFLEAHESKPHLVCPLCGVTRIDLATHISNSHTEEPDKVMA